MSKRPLTTDQMRERLRRRKWLLLEDTRGVRLRMHPYFAEWREDGKYYEITDFTGTVAVRLYDNDLRRLVEFGGCSISRLPVFPGGQAERTDYRLSDEDEPRQED